MKKLAAILSLFLMTGMATAVVGADNPDNQPSITDNRPDQAPDNITDKGNQTGLGNLPDQASDTAKKVTKTVQNALQDGVKGLGETLRNILGQ